MTDPQPTVVELLARGYTREQIAAWQQAQQQPTEQPNLEPEAPSERTTRRRKA